MLQAKGRPFIPPPSTLSATNCAYTMQLPSGLHIKAGRKLLVTYSKLLRELIAFNVAWEEKQSQAIFLPLTPSFILYQEAKILFSL